MKYFATLFAAFLFCGSVAAQEVTPPTFNGGAVKFFRARLTRAIRNSRGKWTPRKVDGVAQRTPYEVQINYVNDSAE